MTAPEPSRVEDLLAKAARLHGAGDLSGAVQTYRGAIQLDPGCFYAYHSLGEIFAGLNDLETALIFFNAAATLQPAAHEIHSNIATIHRKSNRLELAVTHLQQAIALSPQSPDYYNHLGSVLLAQGKTAEAETSIRHALSIDPHYAEGYANLGYLQSQTHQPEAEPSYRRAIHLKPDLAQAHVNLSHLLLRRGAFSEGWLEAEWRWKWKEFPSPKRGFTQPQWRGEPLRGRTLLLHAEQGFGDTLQMLRYVPLLVDRGARVILEVHPELRGLAAGVCRVESLLSRGDALPHFDLHCPLMSLPLAFRTDGCSIPAHVPYLFPETASPAWIHASDAIRVGLVWAGSRKNVVDRSRSLSLDRLAPLFSTRGVDFYSLQMDASEGSRFRGSLPSSADFSETATAITLMDLVISVDTAVAHLAGALGRPVWVLLPFVADWRWLRDRDDSPWYPSARLFRQQHAGDWTSVLEQICVGLRSLVHKRFAGKVGSQVASCDKAPVVTV